jgi:uncharacterized membrane protein YwaF
MVQYYYNNFKERGIFMNTFEKIIYALSARMEKPPLFGTWHIVSLVLTLALAAFMVWKFKNCSDKTLRIILGIFWGVMICFEVYKQLVYSMPSDGIAAYWNYQWYAFPFQFCSTPLFLLPFVIFAKEGKFRNAIVAYMITFSFFAGVLVMVYPGDVFSSIIGINIQTMVHHGLQLVMGAFLVAHNRHHLSKRYFAWSMIVFSVIAVIALIFNVAAYHYIPEESVNMFYLSPYVPCTLPILSVVYASVPYPVYLLAYVFGFALVSLVFYASEKGIVALCSKIKHRGEK